MLAGKQKALRQQPLAILDATMSNQLVVACVVHKLCHPYCLLYRNDSFNRHIYTFTRDDIIGEYLYTPSIYFVT